MHYDYIKNNNLSLLSEMNKAVGMLQASSEKKVRRLIMFQTIGLIVAIILMAISILQIHGIIKKLFHSASIAKKMSAGDLTKRFQIADKPELKLYEMDYMGYHLNGFAQSLQNSMKNIYKEAMNLNTSSTEMMTVAKDINEVSQSVTHISSNSTIIAKSSKQLSKLAEELHEMVDHFTLE